jgi:acyl transferase domain-containing protein/NADP-dependent 3-hydroxy acid dehydrogenase YdfG
MSQQDHKNGPRALPPHLDGAIAVVGLSVHVPGADDLDTFWRNLREGVESISFPSSDEMAAAGVSRELLDDPRYVRAGGFLERMEWFDAGFFGLSPRDAAIMDPQTRHFLECCWHALEHAGHLPERFDGSVGVFAGAGAGQYFWKNVVRDPELMAGVGYFLLRHTGNDKDFLSTRASYEFDLKGPSVSIQTACSTSLVAIHYACQSLLSWECDMALAGGVTIEQPHRHGYLFEEGEILSPDGHCRSFDHRSAGTVFGSGAGVVVLRRLSEAVEAGDTIHAVIRGSAVNNDGAGKVSYLAPSVDGQSKAVAEALSLADVDPASIGLVEGHGTATPVGDPIEVAALTQAFRVGTAATGYCALGSIKSNIGHLDTAAGVASLAKAVLALQNRTIPPTVHFEAPNPLLDLEASPFFINGEARPWPAGPEPRRAGVNSLGVGGTNAHVILEEAPEVGPSGPSRTHHLLTLSTRSAPSLEDAARGLLEHLEAHPDGSLADLSYTLRQGRRAFPHRRAVVCRDASEAVEALATGQGAGLTSAQASSGPREVAFLFAGGGAQYPGMARGLYETEPVFREEVDRCLDILDGVLDFDLRPLLFARPGGDFEAATAALQRPSHALPALFTVQMAQARLWMSWGIEPAHMVGHSMGEYTAACLAGVFSLEDALSIVSLRGRLFETVDPGAMLGVGLGEDALEALLGDDLSIAAVNAPEATVAAGSVAAVDRLDEHLVAAGVDTRRIRIDVAAHSHMLDPILETFGRHLRTLRLRPPSRPFVSNLSGSLAGDEVAQPEYWVRHLRHTVRFAEGIGSLLSEDGPLLLEVGPGRTLATLGRMQPKWTSAQPTLASLPGPRDEDDPVAFMLATLGALWAHGVDVDWAGYDRDQRRHRVPAPLYPFERKPYFVSPPAEEPVTELGSPPAVTTAVGMRDGRIARLDDWVHQPTWTPLPPAMPAADAPTSPTLLLIDPEGPAFDLVDQLRESVVRLMVVAPGEAFAIGDSASGQVDVRLRPGAAEDWARLWTWCAEDGGGLPATVIHAWCLTEAAHAVDAGVAQDRAFFAPFHLLRTLEEVSPGHQLHLVAAVTGGSAASDEGLVPEHALIQGPVRVAPRELPSISTRLIDPGHVPSRPAPRREMLTRLIDEIRDTGAPSSVAYRGTERLAPSYARVPLSDPGPVDGLADHAVVLLTGGLGGIGLALARSLAARRPLRFVLTSRSGLPHRDRWSDWLAGHGQGDKTSRAIREVRAIEAMGSEIEVIAADVTDPVAMRGVADRAQARFGGVDVAIHAAGILDDGPLLMRTPEQVHAVLSPKVAGARALDEAVAALDPGLFIVFSSVSAVLGAAGQVDYTAANAYLDAFARERRHRTGRRTLSLAWGAWRDVGMAAELAEAAHYGPAPGDGGSPTGHPPLEHPLFEQRVPLSGGAEAFRMSLEWGRHWMLDEHRTRQGERLLPGAGYVELIQSALELLEGPSDHVIRNLAFLRPFKVAEGERRLLDVVFEDTPTGWRIAVRGHGPDESGWTDHATARVERTSSPVSREALAAVVARVGPPSDTPRPAHPVMDFGPRWNNVVAASIGDGEALLTHRLPDAFHADLAVSRLHPALFDMATAGAPDLVPGIDPAADFLIPAGYGQVRVFGSLGSSMTSHIKLRDSDDGLASFDVTIYGDDGTVVAVVDDFSMMKVARNALSEHADDAQEPDWLRHAITPAEGAELFRRIVARPGAAHLLIVPRPLETLISEVGRAPTPRGRTHASPAPARVLLPDVARALEAHEAVAEAAVLGSDDEVAGPNRRVAFVVYHPGHQATVSELRRFLRKGIDRSAVPQNFVEMVSLPRQSDGSITPEELRDPFAAADTFVAPRSPTEQAIAEVWSELLGLDRVGIHDNFLDAGGHSLVGIRVLSRIHKATGVRLEANALTLQTLEQLAAEIDRAAGNGAAA